MNKAIVTGASSGIGKAICRQLAANGWLVYGIGRSFNQSDDIAGIERIVCDITDTAKLITPKCRTTAIRAAAPVSSPA